MVPTAHPGASRDDTTPLRLEHVACNVCGRVNNVPVGVGEDFEYRTSPDCFLAVQCASCGLVYLDPRPAPSELDRIYPDTYHAFQFTQSSFGLVHRVRSRLEAKRLLKVLGELPDDAKILDVGCGDGFHMDLLRRFGRPGWSVHGIDIDRRAVDAATDRGLTVFEGTIETAELAQSTYDAALLIQTIEHVADPAAVLRAILQTLKPGGRLMIVTDNTGSLDFRLFRKRHWGGYHFPRHFNLFNKNALGRLATSAGFAVDEIETIVSPVNWVYSIRNVLDDNRAPRWLVNRFSLSGVLALTAFTVFDSLHNIAGRGALLRAVVTRPR
jgi:2-polyprenyl-3-methyl-5-hydroxy-6-metoxy-1,4-benzoquinol methylase